MSNSKTRKCLGNDKWSQMKISKPSFGGTAAVAQPESFDEIDKLWCVFQFISIRLNAVVFVIRLLIFHELLFASFILINLN